MTAIDRLRAAVRDVPDFPKPGIVFKDITPLLADGATFAVSIDLLCERLAGRGVQKIAGIDARGFIFAGAVAARLGLGFIPIRKKGKLPWRTHEQSYALEYGENTIAIHQDAVCPGETVALVDDVLATGGTAGAAIALLRRCGAGALSAEFLMELSFLNGREKLAGLPVGALLIY